MKLKIQPVSAGRWRDLEKLFGERGACGGWWGMWWRLPRAQIVSQKSAGKPAGLRQIVASRPPPRLLADFEGEPVGWCALAPRKDYPRLANSWTLKPLDDQPVWSITCFFILRPYRRRGVTLALLQGAVRFAARCGAKILEGYPSEPKP